MFGHFTIPAVVLALLATWRITHLLAKEDGPYDLLLRWRNWVGRTGAGRLFTCFQCLSLWIGALLAALFPSDWLEFLVLATAFSGGACLLERLGGDPLVVQALPETKPGEESHELLWQSNPYAGYADEHLFRVDRSLRRPH